MRKIEMETGNRSGELEGFTLFMNPGKGWQMSTRRKGEHGWAIQIVPEADAQRLFAIIGPIDHPDGPFKVLPEPASLLTAMQAAESAVRSLTAALEARAG